KIAEFIHRKLINPASFNRMVIVIVFLALPCMAQQDRGTILGVVQDTSQSVIAGATVLVENQGTGAALSLTTDASGIFVVPDVSIGAYRVTASYQGFKRRVQEDVVLRVSDRLRLVLTLQPGDIKE